MKNLKSISLLAFCFLLLTFFYSCKKKVKYEFAFQNPELSFEERAKDIVAKLTLDEKVLQMQNTAPAIPRLGIKPYKWDNECLHGVANTPNVTVFPQAIAISSTFDTSLIHQAANIISSEARALYYESLKKDTKVLPKGLTYWAPNINIFRDPRWGRGQETYGEDPFLTSSMVVPFVKGLQGSDPKYLKVVSTPKHYAVHSGPESSRHKDDIHTSKRDLYETYLPAFEASVRKGGAYSIMGAYTSYLGVPCCASKFLLEDILRKKWGFNGYVTSDCGAIEDIYVGHKYSPDAASGCAVAIKAGCDLTCGGEYVALKDAVKKGLITEKEIDVSLTRLMLARMKLGLFDPPEIDPYSKIPFSYVDNKESRELALNIAKRSMVLLKNEKNTLPIDRNKIKTIAVVGANADDKNVLYGNYNGTPSKAVTVLEGIKAKFANSQLPTPNSELVSYVKGCSLYIPVYSGEPIPPALFKEGLKAEFFNNMNVQGTPVLVRTDKNIDFNWTQGSPDPKVNADFFSCRWTGKMVPDITGEYELVIKVNNCFRLYIDNKIVIDKWTDLKPGIIKAKYHFTAGRAYDIRLEHFEKTGDAEIHLCWKGPGAFEKFKKAQAKKINEDFEQAKKIIEKSDAVIYVGGISPELEGEEMDVYVDGFAGGDRTNIDLPQVQENFLKKISSLGKPVIMVLMNGSALAINWEKENIPAILEAWYPGEEGGNAVADVLFGDYNPAGRLPITFYKSDKDLPPFGDYNMKDRTYRYFSGKTLFPFGHGLSYTNFEYSNLKLSKNTTDSKGSVVLNLDVKNSGNYDGDEVVQLYVKQVERSFLTTLPLKSLKGFKRISLKKGESKSVQINLNAEDLRYFNEQKDDYVVEPGKYELQLGASSDDIRLKEILEIK